MPKCRKMLGSATSPYILSLMRAIETQSKRTLVAFCIDYATAHYLPLYERARPDDSRPRAALAAAQDWLDGKIKLPAAKPFLLAAHEAARELEDSPALQAAARAIGQGASSIHSATHSLGIAFYGAAAVAYERVGLTESPEVYDALAAEECARIEAALRAISVENEPNPAKINWNC